MTPIAYLIQYRLAGPAAMVTFVPALWLLVPGSLGLIGMTELASDNSLAGVENFTTTLFSIVAIALGSLVGSGVYNLLFDPIFRGRAQWPSRYGAASALSRTLKITRCHRGECRDEGSAGTQRLGA